MVVSESYASTEMRRYQTGPVDPSVLGGSCGHYSTSPPTPDGVVTRSLVYPARSAGSGFGPPSGCNKVAAFTGWHSVWHIHAPPDAWFDSVYRFGHVLVLREDVYLAPNILVGLDVRSGRTRWRWQCGDGNDEYLTDDEYHGYEGGYRYQGKPWVRVECSYGAARINPLTGKQDRGR